MNALKRMSALIISVLCIGMCNLSGAMFNADSDDTAYAVSSADIIESGDWSYYILDSKNGIKNIAVTKYSGEADFYLEIPSVIDGCCVTAIEGTPFAGNELVGRVVIPDSVQVIGDNVFNDSIIYNITVNKKQYSLLYTINEWLTNDRHSVMLADYNIIQETDEDTEPVDIEIPETVGGLTVRYIGDCVFQGESINSVVLPDTINYFGRDVFRNSSVESVNIPAALRVIPSRTFAGCSNLKNVEFHEQLIVAKSAFRDTNVTLPDYLKYPESTYSMDNSYEMALYNDGPWQIVVSGNKESDQYTGEYTADIFGYDIEKDTNISDGKADIVIPDYLWDIPVRSVNEKFWKNFNNAGITLCSITFPEKITQIKRFNLDYPEELTEVVIKASDVTIDFDAFKNTGIEEIVFNGSCVLNNGAFSGCESLKSIRFMGENPSVDIGSFAFENCSSLSSLTINGKGTISANAFRRCKNLESVDINGDFELGPNAFMDNTALTALTIDTAKPINGSAFNGCSSLMNINSQPAFDSVSGGFEPKLDDFLFKSFSNADNVGFLNLYISQKAKEIAESCTDSSMSDIQKIKALHDRVCEMVVYDYEDLNALKNHNDASIFMNDSSICEGYAKGYNLLLNAAGIESYYVDNSNHAWNIVKLGGHYFHVDTTWDDGDNISYEWFLKSDDELRQETSSHLQWKTRCPSPMHSFQSETLPECRYSMGDLNTDGLFDVADLVTMSNYLLGKPYVSDDDIVLADMDFDGSVDAFDLVKMRILAVNTNSRPT